MKTVKEIVKIIISALLLIYGCVLVYLALSALLLSPASGDGVSDSFRDGATLMSNLVLGVLLVASAIVFFINKKRGSRLFEFSGIMAVLYGINQFIFGVIGLMIYEAQNGDTLDSTDIGLILDPFHLIQYTAIPFLGLLIYGYYMDKKAKGGRLKSILLYTFIGIVIYLGIDIINIDQWY